MADEAENKKAMFKKLSINQLFQLLDANSDGKLTKAEVVENCSKLELSEEDAAALFDDLDKDGSGELTREEAGMFNQLRSRFGAWGKKTARAALPPASADLEGAAEDLVEQGRPTKATASEESKPNIKKFNVNQLFEMLDGDADGALTRAEVMAGAEKLELTAEEAGALFDELDTDSSGELSKTEMKGMIGRLGTMWKNQSAIVGRVLVQSFASPGGNAVGSKKAAKGDGSGGKVIDEPLNKKRPPERRKSTAARKEAYKKMVKGEQLEVEGEEDANENKKMVLVMCVMGTIVLLAIIDGFTTKLGEKMAHALGNWTLDNAPGSFFLYEFIIMVLVICCLPYGPLAVLSGALFTQKYGEPDGIFIAGFALFVSTLTGEFICFLTARYKMKETVQKKIQRTEELKFLLQLDLLIDEGQGIEVVMLLRLAPIPKGPANYFLGTTAVTVRDFAIGSCIINLPMCFLDVCIGAGAKHVDSNSPISILAFASIIILTLGLIAFIGLRAKKKLEALEERERLKTEGADSASGAADDEDFS
jgi:uncharacterized membrane protein YdjX (TVP38/TMEM64 family)/Ca2+-binding EF-hand superfamily protein